MPPDFNFARHVVDELGKQDRRGLLFVDTAGVRREYGFPELAATTRRWAGMLDELGVAKGERVVVLLPKIPEWLFAMVALDRLGAVVIPCSEQLRAKDLAFRAVHSEATTVVGHISNQPEVDLMRELAPGVSRYLLVGGEAPGWIGLEPLLANAQEIAGNPTAAEEMAYIVYTSGTTKDPKGVVHAHAYTHAKSSQAKHWLDAKPEDLVWCTAGTGWAKSLWNVLLGPWSCGSAIVLHEGGFDPAQRMARRRRSTGSRLNSNGSANGGACRNYATASRPANRSIPKCSHVGRTRSA